MTAREYLKRAASIAYLETYKYLDVWTVMHEAAGFDAAAIPDEAYDALAVALGKVSLTEWDREPRHRDEVGAMFERAAAAVTEPTP
ncbi:MAG TPA: hypothetical protein VD931_03425 [Baekduia sp.]|nr:hypothetical protein [Baekduia sp.]